MNRADRHTRMVGWLKLVLPLAALAILSMLFLVARTIDPGDAIPYAEVDVAERVREPRMTAPEYAGTTSDGGSITLVAQQARPGEGGNASAVGVRATLITPDTRTTVLTADSARIDAAANQLHLEGAVMMETSTGYRIASDAMVAALDRSGLSTDSGVTADGPVGRVTAQSMELTAGPSGSGSHLLVFKTGVKLVYLPGN